MADTHNPRRAQRNPDREDEHARRRHVSGWWAWLLLLGVLATQSARAEAPCPYEAYATPERCEKLARRAYKLGEREARKRAILDYRAQHPWRVSLLADASFSALGLKDMYAAGLWGVGAGASVLRELLPTWALRMDVLARFGSGRIRMYNPADSGLIETSAGYVGGVELRTAWLWRLRAVYVGPAVALGYLHLRESTLDAADFATAVDDAVHDETTLHIPANAPFLGLGVVLGGEPIPRGPYSINVHFTPGAWGDMRHLYLSVALELSIKLWD
jgi:hypothetical protein